MAENDIANGENIERKQLAWKPVKKANIESYSIYRNNKRPSKKHNGNNEIMWKLAKTES
jgi:hypothetical protein